jgi:hypothetical protein
MRNVSQLQEYFVAKGYLAATDERGNSNVDGIFGTESLAAYNRARAALGLKPHEGMLILVEINRVLFPDEQPAPPVKKPSTLQNWLTGLAIEKAVSSLKGLLPMAFLTGYKTFATAFVIAIMGVYSLIFGELPLVGATVDPGSAILALLSSLGIAFGRVGAKTEANKALDK